MKASRLPAGITAEYLVWPRGFTYSLMDGWTVQARNQTEAKRKVVAMPNTPALTVAELDAKRMET